MQKRIVVLGGVGFIGTHLCLRLLEEGHEVFCVDIRDAVNSPLLRGVLQHPLFRYVHHNIINGFSIRCDEIYNLASPSRVRYNKALPVETLRVSVLGAINALDTARTEHARVVFASAGNIYGIGQRDPASEPGNCCSTHYILCEGKRAAENLCVSYHSEYQVPVKAVRLAQTFGPGIPRDDVRLFAALARNAVAGKDFVMKTTGESTRMYSYTADAVSAILTVLVAGENGVSYNVANPSTYSSIREMADMVYREFGTGDAHVIIDVDPNAPYPPEHHLPLDVSRLEALGWRPQVGLEDMYRKLIAYMG